MYYVENYSDNKDWDGLCTVIGHTTRSNRYAYTSILVKIEESLEGRTFLHAFLRDVSTEFDAWMGDFSYPYKEHCNIRNMLRRIWITKLLAYEGE